MSLTLDTEAGTITLTKTGESMSQVEHKDLTRAIATPLSLVQTAKIGQPGTLGNDHIIIKASDAVSNTETGRTVVGSITVDVSIPRDAVFTAQHTEDLVCMVRSFLALTNQEDAIGQGVLNRS